MVCRSLVWRGTPLTRTAPRLPALKVGLSHWPPGKFHKPNINLKFLGQRHTLRRGLHKAWPVLVPVTVFTILFTFRRVPVRGLTTLHTYMHSNSWAATPLGGLPQLAIPLLRTEHLGRAPKKTETPLFSVHVPPRAGSQKNSAVIQLQSIA